MKIVHHGYLDFAESLFSTTRFSTIEKERGQTIFIRKDPKGKNFFLRDKMRNFVVFNTFF